MERRGATWSDRDERLDLAGLSITNSVLPTDLPGEKAVSQTLAGVWSDLFALFTDTALEADVEDLALGFVNLFHRAVQRKSGTARAPTYKVASGGSR